MRRASKQQRLRHQLVADWRGAMGAPLIDNPVVSLQAVIPGVLKDWKLDDALRLDDAAATWRELVGEFIARQTMPDSLKRGVLTVRVLQPAVHHTLLQEKGRLLQKMQERFGKTVVREVKFRHG